MAEIHDIAEARARRDARRLEQLLALGVVLGILWACCFATRERAW